MIKYSTKFILPSEISVKGYDKAIGIDTNELHKLAGLTVTSRMFLIKQDGKSIASELSIGGLPGFTLGYFALAKQSAKYI